MKNLRIVITKKTFSIKIFVDKLIQSQNGMIVCYIHFNTMFNVCLCVECLMNWHLIIRAINKFMRTSIKQFVRHLTLNVMG